MAIWLTPETRRVVAPPEQRVRVRVSRVRLRCIRGDVGDMVDGGSGPAEFGGNVVGGDVVRAASGVIVTIEGSVSRGGEGAEVFDAMVEGADGAQVDMSPDAPCPRASPWVQFFWSV